MGRKTMGTLRFTRPTNDFNYFVGCAEARSASCRAIDALRKLSASYYYTAYPAVMLINTILFPLWKHKLHSELDIVVGAVCWFYDVTKGCNT